jgi:hypothetical protein
MNEDIQKTEDGKNGIKKPRLWLFFLAVILAAAVSLANYSWIKSLNKKHDLLENISMVREDLGRIADEISAFRLKEGSYPRINNWVAQMAAVRRHDKGLLPGQKETMLPNETGIEFTFDPFKKNRDHYEYGVRATRSLDQTEGPFIISSFGPDGDNDLIDLKVTEKAPEYGQSDHLLNFAYDPTNGLYSNGDIFVLDGLPDESRITSF